ncbi:MAG: type II toxin-antitoxin system PemK/MazF family toxin [Chloroflexi bacterium]|jgi:mRNA interferase MazF|nr:type II toxin-antitoxin system PemK/MazF family toxin [Chloroflexota bacterium]
MVIQRGEIWWASLPEPAGSDPGYRRPVIVVQSNAFNRSRIATVVAVIVTSNTYLAQAPGNVLLPKRMTGLSKDSVVNVSQVITVDKRFLTELVGTLPTNLIEQIEAGLRLVLEL